MGENKPEPKGGFASAAEKAAWIRGDKPEKKAKAPVRKKASPKKGKG